jgi:uroporphyrin-3 C-methyltransferase
MEPQSMETTDALSDKTVASKPKSCVVAWFAISLLCITWLCFFLGLTFFLQKKNNILSSYTAKLIQIQQQLAQTQTEYQELQRNLDKIQNFVQKKFSFDDSIVRISNVKQLIQLAQYNLIYLHDRDSALSALTLTEKQLEELSKSPISFTTLQNLLTKNIASLKTLPYFSLSSVLAKLQNLQTQITQLSLIDAIAVPQKININPHSQATPREKWWDAIQSSLRSFQQLIVIRRLDKPIEPLLPQVQQQYLQYNLQLLLQQAQWALLHNQASVYQMSLQQIREAVQRHFVGNLAATQVVQAIDELQRINLQPTLPDLNPMLEDIAVIDKTMTNASRSSEQKDFFS